MAPSPRIVSELDALTALGGSLADRARGRGVVLIWRAPSRAVTRVLVRSGRVEEVATSSGSGHGVHVATAEGRTALASRDDFLPEPAAALFERTARAAEETPALGVQPSALASL